MKPFQKKFSLYTGLHQSLPKSVAKEIVFSILSESEGVDNSTIHRWVDWVIQYWKPFASYWNKDIVIDEETDSKIFPMFMELSEDRKKYLAIDTNFTQIVPSKDREAYFNHLQSFEMDNGWKVNLRTSTSI